MAETRRMKPEVASRNNVAAVANIVGKIRAIEAVLSIDPVSTELLAQLPASLNQFNEWALQKGSIRRGIPDTDLRSNGPQTLRRDSDLSKQAKAALGALKEVTGGRRLSGREQRFSNVQARLSLSEKLRRVVESRYCDLLSKVESLKNELAKADARYTSSIEKANAELLELRDQLQEERKKSAELARAFRNVKPLRGS